MNSTRRLSRNAARAVVSALTGLATAAAIVTSLWLAHGPAEHPSTVTLAVAHRSSACQHWTRTGPISNANNTPVWVVDLDGAVPLTKIPAHGRASFTWRYAASVARRVDTVLVYGTADRAGRPLNLAFTITRPASCR